MNKLAGIIDASDALDEKLNIIAEAEAFTPDNMKLLSEIKEINNDLYTDLLQETAARSQTDRVLKTAIQKINGMSRSINTKLHTMAVEHENNNKEINDKIAKLESSKKRERYYIYAIGILFIFDIMTILVFHPDLFREILMILHSVSAILK